MKVLFDSSGLYQRYGGVGKYFAELMKHLPPGYEWSLAFDHTINASFQEPPFNLPAMRCSSENIVNGFTRGMPARALANLLRYFATKFPSLVPVGEGRDFSIFSSRTKALDFDVFHITNPHPRWNTWRKVVGRRPIVVTIHDLIPELFKKDALVKRARLALLKDASHIITVSQKTKSDVKELYGVPDEMISVIYHGYTAQRVDVCVATDWVPKKFILYVGKREGYKNFVFFLKAISVLMNEDKDLFLVCTGDAFTHSEMKLLMELGISRQVIQRYVADDELKLLYRMAVAFVYPSLYEGFGLPILDAFSEGCPVILSDQSCFPEVGKDAALYFHKGDSAELRAMIRLIMEDKMLRGDMIDRGARRVRAFSWDDCAKQTAYVYENVYKAYV